jgi:diguanylate cyclase (GGDEF)-like protein
MRLRLPGRPRLALRVRSKFLLVFAVLVPVIFAVPVAGISGLAKVRDDAERIYAEELEGRVAQHVASEISQGYELALRLVRTTDPAYQGRLDEQLAGVIARVDIDLATLRRLHAQDSAAERARVERLSAGWQRFVRLSHSDAFDTIGSGAAAARQNDATALQVARTLDPVRALADVLTATDAANAKRSRDHTLATYAASRSTMLALAAFAILASLGALLWLIRDIVPRTRSYSRFAAGVAAGATAEPIEPRGSDELADLGRTLNDMVAQREAERAYARSQAEFADAMQVTASEEEAHGLLKRHLERSIHASEAVVLNRNNSHDRLEPTTPVAPGSPLEHAFADAQPRSCLAVRYGRGHEEDAARTPLLECELCGKRASARSTCEPLLVSGEVIGSVLVQHPAPLAADERGRIKNSVVQAAPVLANLRNLAIAELRASTDALTGLPDNRALQGNMKRLVALAARTESPLAVLALDLDHFKQINDTFGHGKGDEVLAAVGAVLQATLRESDFVGRWGGEEFMLLLPGVDRDGALIAAEKVRKAVTRVKVADVDRTITASLGMALFPDDAADVTTLTRNADRALYTAKANGRDRVEAFTAESRNGVPIEA